MGIRGSAVTEAAGSGGGPPRAATPMLQVDTSPPAYARPSSNRGLHSSGSAPCLTPASSAGGGHNANLTNTQYKKEVAYKEAMERPHGRLPPAGAGRDPREADACATELALPPAPDADAGRPSAGAAPGGRGGGLSPRVPPLRGGGAVGEEGFREGPAGAPQGRLG